jgi:hypothetical protein
MRLHPPPYSHAGSLLGALFPKRRLLRLGKAATLEKSEAWFSLVKQGFCLSDGFETCVEATLQIS